MIATAKPHWLLPVAALALTGCGKYADDLFCSDPACAWTDAQWMRLSSLANPDPPEPDLSNAYWSSPAARELGKLFYFDTGFSGAATQTDALGRPSPPAR